jgi:hypothetical protein
MTQVTMNTILACIGLLIFIRLWVRNKKNLSRPYFSTTELFVVILKENPYDFEGNKVFDTKNDAEQFRFNLPEFEKYHSEAIETALDKLKANYFDKGVDGFKTHVKNKTVTETLDEMLKEK